jgi:hypothetical protein
MQLRPRINSLEKNCFYDLPGVPNTGFQSKYYLVSKFPGGQYSLKSNLQT